GECYLREQAAQCGRRQPDVGSDASGNSPRAPPRVVGSDAPFCSAGPTFLDAFGFVGQGGPRRQGPTTLRTIGGCGVTRTPIESMAIEPSAAGLSRGYHA